LPSSKWEEKLPKGWDLSGHKKTEETSEVYPLVHVQKRITVQRKSWTRGSARKASMNRFHLADVQGQKSRFDQSGQTALRSHAIFYTSTATANFIRTTKTSRAVEVGCRILKWSRDIRMMPLLKNDDAMKRRGFHQAAITASFQVWFFLLPFHQSNESNRLGEKAIRAKRISQVEITAGHLFFSRCAFVLAGHGVPKT